MAEWRDRGMAEGRNGGMVWYFTTYLIYPAILMVHTDDANNNTDDTNDTNDTDGF
jgi:hypothetical protein